MAFALWMDICAFIISVVGYIIHSLSDGLLLNCAYICAVLRSRKKLDRVIRVSVWISDLVDVFLCVGQRNEYSWCQVKCGLVWLLWRWRIFAGEIFVVWWVCIKHLLGDFKNGIIVFEKLYKCIRLKQYRLSGFVQNMSIWFIGSNMILSSLDLKEIIYII